MKKSSKAGLGGSGGGFADYMHEVVRWLNLSVQSVEVEGEHQAKALAKSHDPSVKGLVLVEVTNYRRRVGYHPLMALKEEQDGKGLGGVVFMSLSGFTSDALQYARANNIRLLTAEDLEGPRNPSKDEHRDKQSLFEQVFLGSMGLQKAAEHFERRRKKPILGVVGLEEKVDIVEGRFAPVGCFALVKGAGGGRTPQEGMFYVNLNTCLIYFVHRGFTGNSVTVKSSNVLRRLMDLNEGAVAVMSWIFEEKEVVFDSLDARRQSVLVENAQNVTALEGMGLISQGTGGRSLLSNLSLPPFGDSRYDLRRYLSCGESVESGFAADPITYPPQAILALMSVFYSALGEFRGVTYIQYFRCRYAASDGRVRFDMVEDFKPKDG
jgi:hypothetical protein